LPTGSDVRDVVVARCRSCSIRREARSFRLPLFDWKEISGSRGMAMKITSEQQNKQSRYVSAGSPQNCFLPSCRAKFEGTCVRGHDGHFYCSASCADIGNKIDLSRVEELRSKMPALPPPQQKIAIGKG
jgi:hypothetical protein